MKTSLKLLIGSNNLYEKVIVVIATVILMSSLSSCHFLKTKVKGSTDIQKIEAANIDIKPPVSIRGEHSQLFQMILDLPEMNEFYHVDVFPERKPIKILSKEYALEELTLYKFDMPVELISLSQAGDVAAYLEFTDININGNSAEVEYLYLAEGVKGDASFTLNNSHWQITSKNIVEQ